MRLPISFRMLLLPVGQSVPQTAPIIATAPQSQSVVQNGTVTLSVAARGSPQPLSYQWSFNGNIITNATKSSLTLSNVQLSATGSYIVDVTNLLGAAHGSATLTVVPTAFSTVMTPLWNLAPGSRPYLVNDNSQRGIAYSAVSGNLLLASGAAGSNAIYVLDGNTGAFVRTLNTDPGIITGGAIALNRVAVADDGSVWACNLTTNGTTQNLQLYSWFGDDNSTDPRQLAWSGDPGVGVADRWGDTLAVRGSGAFTEVWLGARSSARLACIQPTFGPSSPATVLTVTAADPGDFGYGFAFGEGNTVWGKAPGGLLRRAQLDLNFFTGQVLDSYSGYPGMAPIGVNPNNKLLAGVSIETPDNLRLFDLSDLGAGLYNLDTEFFPTDNPNPNSSGAVAFGGSAVYALDSNNGLIAMNLTLNCVPAKLSGTRSGTHLVLSWGRADYRLQGATTLGGWSDIAGSSPVNVSVNSGIKYFRLVCP